jgi:hypothetical protein
MKNEPIHPSELQHVPVSSIRAPDTSNRNAAVAGRVYSVDKSINQRG